MMFRQVERFII